MTIAGEGYSALPWRFGNTSPGTLMILDGHGRYVCHVQVEQAGGGDIARCMEGGRRAAAQHILDAVNALPKLVEALEGERSLRIAVGNYIARHTAGEFGPQALAHMLLQIFARDEAITAQRTDSALASLQSKDTNDV